MGSALPRAAAADAPHYERRRPEQTVLYQPVQGHLETFLVQVEASTGAPLPRIPLPHSRAVRKTRKMCKADLTAPPSRRWLWPCARTFRFQHA